jgi:ABC-type multidrug transport system ATPase subunit
LIIREVSFFHQPSSEGFYLVKDSWNDFGFQTLYTLYYYDKRKVDIGRIKIATKSENESTILPNDTFTQLDPEYFSLGQNSKFYLKLNKLESHLKEFILRALNDISYNLEIFDEVKELEITRTALLREVNSFTVKDKFNRIINNGAELTKYNFQFPMQFKESIATFDFLVRPNSVPPSNIHAIIGSNGVGKTTLLKNMVNSVINLTDSPTNKFVNIDDQDHQNIFANIIFISFSAFDIDGYYKDKFNEHGESYYSYVGLREEITADKEGETNIISKDPDKLSYEFLESIKIITSSSKDNTKFQRWQNAIRTLETDNILKSFQLTDINKLDENSKVDLFTKLSSGHKLIVLILTRLIEKGTEKSLIIIDEPESHLHPPLLSSFINALSKILINQNGVSIIATHSPVVLQELPKTCISILRRGNEIITVNRPEIETFGENVGTLTREVFGLEATNSGYHTLLKKQVNQGKAYEEILEDFDGALGFEARTVLRSLIAEKEFDSE